MGEAGDTRRALIGGLARAAPHGSSLLQIGLPGGDMADIAAAAGLRVMTALTPALLRLHVGAAAALAALPGAIAVAARACESHDALMQPLAGAWLDRAPRPQRYRALGAVMAELRSLSILHVGPLAPHAELVVAVLADLQRSGTILWLDLPPGAEGLAAATRVLAAVPAAGFETYGLSGRQVTMYDPGAGPDLSAIPPTALILLPRAGWAGYGLQRLAGAAARNAPWAERLAALAADPAVPQAKCASDRVLGHLAAARIAPAVPVLPPESVLPLHSRLFADRADPGRGATATGGLPAVDFRFMAPGQGIFQWSIVLGAEPDPALHDDLRVTLSQGGAVLADTGLVPDMARREMQATTPLPVGAARLPVGLRIYRHGRRRSNALALPVTGLILWPQAATPTLAVRP